jgi:hypothetical protein
VSYTTESGRQQILEDAAAAAYPLNSALAAIAEIYDHLDEPTADRMETIVFKPLQGGYGQLRRTLTEFAARSGLEPPLFGEPPVALPSGAHAVLEQIAEWAQQADQMIAELQDSLLPVEVGDPELRAGLSGMRTQIASVPGACVSLLRTLGR